MKCQTFDALSINYNEIIFDIAVSDEIPMIRYDINNPGSPLERTFHDITNDINSVLL